jgi:hypothetical protein
MVTKDVQQLFRNINQADLPYQVFEPPIVRSPAIGHAEPEPLVLREPTTWAMEPPAAAKSPVFRKYRADEKAETAAGTPLKPIFDRMREKYQAAQG